MNHIMHSAPELWIRQVFSAKAATNGGVIRRAVRWVDKEIGRERFLQEVEGRGFALLEAGGRYVVICAPGPIRRLI